MTILTANFDKQISISITKNWTGLDRETDRNLAATVEGLDRPTIDKSHRGGEKGTGFGKNRLAAKSNIPMS
jgi:hypothetical protein